MRATRSAINPKVMLYTSTASASTSVATSIEVKASLTRRRTRQSSPIPAAQDVLEELEVKDTKPKKPKVKREPKPIKMALEKAHPTPKRWQEAYEIIRKQRATLVAPVDTLGCEQGGREREEKPKNEQEAKLSTLVSLMLSSQTKDPVTHAATVALRANLPGGLNVESLIATPVEEIDRLICKVGFHQTKATNLKKMAERLRDLHDGKVPEDLPSLLAINGVGPKMSFLFLQSIGINAGIGVDVHVHRITNRLGWHKPATAQAEQTRLNLESWLPKELHPKINLMLVGFGQTICKPVGPRCDLCDVGKVARLCPSKRVVPSPKKGASVTPIKRKLEDDDDEGAKPRVKVQVEEVESEVIATETLVKTEEGVAVVKAEQLTW